MIKKGEEPTKTDLPSESKPMESTATVISEIEDKPEDWKHLNTELYDGILQKLFFNSKLGKYKKEPV